MHLREDAAAQVLGSALPESSSEPGVIVGVVVAEGLITSKSTGTTEALGGVALDDRTAFYVASVSKQFTAACIFLAVDEGQLALDDPLRAFFPELPRWADDVRIEHLLSHASGLPDYGELIESRGRSIHEPFGDDLIIEVLSASEGPTFMPGGAVAYCNTGYVILAMIVRAATGLSLRAFAAERVFGPLAMAETRYRDDYGEERISRLADGHVVVDDRIVRVDSCFDRVGDGGLVTTLTDWAKWEATILGGHEPWLALTHRLAAPFVLADGSMSNWRAGVVIEDLGGERATLAGGTGFGYRAFSARLSGAGFSVCCLSNLETSDVRGLSLRIVELLRKT